MSVATYFDGVNITDRVQEGSVSHTLNGRATTTIKIPIDNVPVGGFFTPSGINSAIYVDCGNPASNFWGRVQHIDDQEDENTGYRLYTAVDPAFILEYRPARDADGDFSKPAFMTAFPQGPAMLQQILQNSVTYEGSLGFSLGTFAAGGLNLSGLPTDWPMAISEIIGLLIQTGRVDVALTYSSTGAMLSAYNGDYGTDRSGTVSFKYAMGTDSNCRGCRRTIDATELMNKLWLYMGPRVGTKSDPAGDQHWDGNITRDHPELAGLPGMSQAYWATVFSRSTFLERMQIRILDEDYDAAHVLYLHYWIRESLLRANPKTLVFLTPDRGTVPAFHVGDRIHVQAGTSFAGGFSGTQRVYSYTYRWGTEGVIELGEPVGQAGAPAVVTSTDQEAVA